MKSKPSVVINKQAEIEKHGFVPKPLSDHSDVYVEDAWNEHLPGLPARAIPLFSLIDVVSSLSIRFHRNTLKNLRYSHTEYAILGTLLLNGSNMRPSFFTKLLSNASAGTSQTLKKLEKQGLLVREPSQTDKRSTLVGLTEKGKELAIQLCRAEAEETFRATRNLSDEDINELRLALGKIVNILR
jgi:DNA-binding MarR family transcriptional regulator